MQQTYMALQGICIPKFHKI